MHYLFETLRIWIHAIKQSDPDPYQIEKQNLDQYQSEKQDPDPYQKGLDPQHWYEVVALQLGIREMLLLSEKA